MKKPTIYVDRKLTTLECFMYAIRTRMSMKRVRRIEQRVHEVYGKTQPRALADLLIFRMPGIGKSSTETHN